MAAFGKRGLHPREIIAALPLVLPISRDAVALVLLFLLVVLVGLRSAHRSLIGASQLFRTSPCAVAARSVVQSLEGGRRVDVRLA